MENLKNESNWLFQANGIKTDKPWGNEILWANGPYVGKLLSIKAGHKLSLQYHKEKIETIMVLNGVLTLEIRQTLESKSEFFTLNPGQNFHTPKGLIHRMIAESTDVQVVEVSTPELDDVVRLEDSYGRVEQIKNGCPSSFGCNHDAQDPHTCPYAEEINDDSETLCTCCDYCTRECAMDI